MQSEKRWNSLYTRVCLMAKHFYLVHPSWPASGCNLVAGVSYYIVMKGNFVFAAIATIAAASLFSGCETVPPGVERGPHGTIAYDVLIEASPPGAKVEANGQVVGDAPVHIKIFGDKDGTFHDFGSDYYIVRGLPITTNQYVQTRVFRTGRLFTPEDRVPQRIYFDMNTPPPVAGAPLAYPDYGGPGYYYPPAYYGPRVQFYFGPGYRHYRRW
jgi:hypothetical protein